MKKSMIVPTVLISSLLLACSVNVWAEQAKAKSPTTQQQKAGAMTSHPDANHSAVAVPHPTKPMPAPKKQAKKAQPHEMMVWIPGDYYWDGDDWVWSDDYWIDQPWADAVWIPGYWVDRSWGWVWIPGHWF